MNNQETSQLVLELKSVGIATATTGLEGVAVAGAKAEAGVIKAREAMDKLSVTSQNVSKSASNLMIQQQKQVDIFGQSREFVNAYNATLKGLSETQVANAAALGAQADQQKAALSAQKQAESQTLALAKANEVLSASIVEATALEKLRVAAEMSTVRSTGTSWAEQAAMRASKSVSQGSVNSGKYSSATQSVISAQNFNMNPLNDSSVAAAKQIKLLEDQANAVKKLEADYVAVTRALDPYAVKLINLDNQLDIVTKAHKAGLSSVQDFRTDVAKIDASKVSVLAKELKATEKATHDAADGMQGFSMASSRAKSELIVMIRELMRGDFTRLAGSMSIFTQETGSMVLVMGIVLNPLTWVVAGLVGLGVAAAIGQGEIAAFNNTMISTGGYATLTANQFSSLSKELGKIGSEGQHGAAAALTEIASTGKFTSDQLATVGKAAIEMQEATGQAVSATIKEFVKLSGDPVKASLELNDKYHYLTISVYEQIRALEDQGNHMEAINAAIHAMADSIAERAPQEVANIGTLETAWNKAKASVVGYWNAALDVGRQKTATEQITALQTQIDRNTLNARNRLGSDGGVDKATQRQNESLQKEIELIAKKTDRETAYAQAAELTAQANAKGVTAAAEVDARMGSIDKETKLQHLLNIEKQRFINLNNAPVGPGGKKAAALDGVTFGTDKDGKTTVSGGMYDQLVADDKLSVYGKGRKPKTNEYGISASLKDQQGLMQAAKQQLQQDLAETKNLYDIGEQTQKEYLVNVLILKETELAKELEIAQKQFEIAGGKKNLTAQSAYANTVAAIYRSMEGDAKAYNQSIDKLDASRLATTDAYTQKLKDAYDLRQAEIDNTLNTANMGTKQQQEYATMLGLQKAYLKEKDDIQKRYDKGERNGGLTKEQFDTEMASAKSDNDARKAQQEKFLADKTAKDADWQTGADKALSDYQATASDVAAQSATAFTNAFQGMENALVSFATTGKISFTGLVTSILTDIARMEAKAATSKLLGLLTQMATTYLSGGLSAQGLGGAATSQTASQAGFTTVNSGFASASAKGNAFSNGSVSMFADGGAFTNGMVNSPTAFNMGLMGEAGPEAIVPLTRTSDGSLGVKQLGGGSSGSPVNVNTSINISSTGSLSAQTSAAGATADQQQFGQAMSNAAQAEIAKQMRQGGLLWKMKNGQTGT